MSERKLVRPDTLDEALGQREHYQKDALPIAGGQSLLVLLRNKLIDPKVLIDLERLGELRGLRRRTEGMSIGAMTTIDNLASSSEVRAAIPILSQAASKVGSTAIRNLGTIGGNLCHNEPGADLPPALLAVDAVAELRSTKKTRKVPLREFFRGYFETAVAPDELLCGIDIPNLPGGASGVYLKHAISAEDLAIAGVAIVLIPDEKRSRVAREIRIGLGGVAPVPFRASKAENVVRGVALDDAVVREAGEIASSEAEPMTDPHGSADYRRKMVKVLVRRAILAAIEQSERNGHGKA
ncbi:MAG TPA: xanthine dehydrogenase family protein subunit M [Candidatus Binatia bacterium]|jgi:CO/xanthine dehydrogenase FAD-binding subunit|nr:xanthine dehydrogenase family protein subunit M [Candidatus Binatia bacterium]